MDWSKSYTTEWRVFSLNMDTWQDGDIVGTIDSMSITRTSDGSMIESGGLVAAKPFDDGYYRVVMTAEQDGDVERVEICTMLYEGTGGSYDKHTYNATGRSVLYPASTTRLLTGAYAPSGVNGAEYAAELLRGAINAPVVVNGGFTLNDNIVHEFGSSVLEAAWSVLNAGGFCMQIDGHGVVHILPMPTEPSLQLGSYNTRLLMPGIDYENDHAAIPNRYTAVLGANVATATNNSPDSIVSTASRGFIVDVVEDDASPVNGETLEAYAERKLREVSTLTDTRTYTREFVPGVLPYSLVEGSIPSVGLDGNLRVVSQTLTCNYGITVQERATKGVQLWQ